MSDSNLSIPEIAAALGSLAARFDVDVLPECDSSNARLVERGEFGAPSGTVVVAESQRAGRGRMGRPWHSTPADSLTFSLLWRLSPRAAPAGLSLAVGVAVAEALRMYAAGAIAVKWPNDILLDGRKLCGVLIELVPGAPNAAVIGIGVNLRLPDGLPDDIRQTATALDRPVNRNEVLACLLVSLHGVLNDFSAQGFAGAIRARWLALNAHASKPIRILSPYTPDMDGTCRGVDDEGALLLETTRGLQRIISGDVSLRPA